MSSLNRTIATLLAVSLLSVLDGSPGNRAEAAGLYEGKDLADQHGCLYCHQVDVKKAGPAYKDVSAKYKGDEQAMITLRKSIRGGSRDKWPGVTEIMQPHKERKVSDEDLDTILKWILSLSS